MRAFKTNVGSGTKANKFGRVWGIPENQSDIKGIFEIYLENTVGILLEYLISTNH